MTEEGSPDKGSLSIRYEMEMIDSLGFILCHTPTFAAENFERMPELIAFLSDLQSKSRRIIKELRKQYRAAKKAGIQPSTIYRALAKKKAK